SSEVLTADYVVLATGTGYPFPAKYLEDATAVATSRLERLREGLVRCREVVIVGGGAVGLELAGELTSVHPGLGVTVVDQAPQVLANGDYLPELRDAVVQQLTDRGVRFVLGAPLGSTPPTDVGTYGHFEVTTTAGVQVEGQMWFRCYGSRPVTDYLGAELAADLRGDGTIPVDEHLMVRGQDRTFAIGDITDVKESKRASAARDHAGVVAQNIRDLVAGRAPSATYSPAPEMIVLPLGPDGGASQLGQPDGSRTVVGAHRTTTIKGADLFSGLMADLFGLER
ncbi:pyridine nucleotide-disulfide oxidoreductase, partial [Cellulomonas bogoriensis 69B4 = DSM 16987]